MSISYNQIKQLYPTEYLNCIIKIKKVEPFELSDSLIECRGHLHCLSTYKWQLVQQPVIQELNEFVKSLGSKQEGYHWLNPHHNGYEKGGVNNWHMDSSRYPRHMFVMLASSVNEPEMGTAVSGLVNDHKVRLWLEPWTLYLMRARTYHRSPYIQKHEAVRVIYRW